MYKVPLHSVVHFVANYGRHFKALSPSNSPSVINMSNSLISTDSGLMSKKILLDMLITLDEGTSSKVPSVIKLRRVYTTKTQKEL